MSYEYGEVIEKYNELQGMLIPENIINFINKKEDLI